MQCLPPVQEWAPALVVMRAPIVALQLLVFPAVALAEIAVDESIEWMVADSDLVVRARFLRRVGIDGSSAGFSVSSYRVEETVLGEPREQLDVFARDLDDEDAGVDGAEYLLFLQKHCRRFAEPALNAAADRAPFELRGWVRLDAPLRQYTMECEVITERAVLLEKARREAHRRSEIVMRPASHWLEVPGGAPAYHSCGSAVYMVVPLDDRLVSLGQAWVRADAQEQDRRESGEESLRTIRARARTLERIAGLAAPDSDGNGDLVKRLARAEAGVADLRGRILRALETCKGGALEKALIRIRLARLSPGPEDRAAVIEVFKHDFDALAAAARKTLWPIVLHEGKEGTDRIMDLCERIAGKVAFNVLRMSAWEDGTPPARDDRRGAPLLLSGPGWPSPLPILLRRSPRALPSRPSSGHDPGSGRVHEVARGGGHGAGRHEA